MGRVSKFLNLYPSANTFKSYKYALRDFFSYIYDVKASGNLERLDSLAERYFSEDRDYREDVQGYQSSLNGRPPKTIRLKIAGVKNFLMENDVELTQRFWKRLSGRVKGNRARTLDRVPSNVELRRILTHMPIQGKALYLTLASSGMRIGEALQLRLDDVDLESDPVKLSIRGEYTKSGDPRRAFISSEAEEALEEWLKNRDRYIKTAVARSKRYAKKGDNQNLFPFTSTPAYSLWSNALKKAGFDDRDRNTHRRKLHPHVLRKFFRTKMGSMIPVDVAEALMGHEGYLTDVYRRYSVEDLAKFYRQGESALLVFTEAEELGKLKVELEKRNRELKSEVDERNRELQDLVNGLTDRNMKLESRMLEQSRLMLQQRREMEKLKTRMGEMEELADRWKSISIDELRELLLEKARSMRE